QSDQRDGNHNLGDGARELVNLIIQLFDVHQPEVVLFIAIQAVLDAHLHPRIFDGRMKLFARTALAVNLKTIASEDLHVRGDRDVNLTVEGATEERTAL